MEALFHLVFSIVKIAVLGCFYATLTLLLFKLIARFKPNSWVGRASRKKLLLWFSSGFLISISLFFYLFSYYGNHGFGDSYRIPVGHGIVIQSMNANEYGYINQMVNSRNLSLETTRFSVQNEMLVGNLNSSFYDYSNAYFAYNLKHKKLKEFKTKEQFDAFAKSHQLPTHDKLKTYQENYRDHWGGWRFWLLP